MAKPTFQHDSKRIERFSSRCFLLLVLLTALSLHAADTLLVSNLEQQPGSPSSSFIGARSWIGAPFLTGNQWTLLSSATLPVLNLGGQGTFWITIQADDNGVPGLPVQNGILNGPARPAGQVTFYTRGEVRLAPNTRYWLVARSDEPEGTGRGYGWYRTFPLDYTGQPNWKLFTLSAYSPDSGVTWIPNDPGVEPYYMGIAGTELANNSPALSITDAVATPMGSGTNDLTFAVHLSRSNALPVSTQFRTVANWTDTNALNPTAGTVTFPPGITNQTITVRSQGSPPGTTNQTFRLQLFNPTNAWLANWEALATIPNNQPSPEVLVLSGIVSESNVRPPNLLAVVRLSRPSTNPVSVAFSTVGITAVAGQSFVPTNGTLTLGGPFPPTQWIPIRVLPNLLDEVDKTLTLELSQPSNCVVSSTPGILTIANNDKLPGMVDHFAITAPPQPLSRMPTPVTVTALDSTGNVVSNFSDRVFFMAGYSNSPPQHFGFEEGDFSQWSILPGGGTQPGPYEMRQRDTTQPGVTNFTFRISPNHGGDGLQRMVSLEGGRGYYISANFAQALDSGPNNGSSIGRIIIDNTEYATATFGNINFGQVQRTNVSFLYNASFSYARYFSLIFDRPFFEASYVGAYVDDVVVSSAPFNSVWSGVFSNGMWTGPVIFPQALNSVQLFAEDVEGHSGTSSPLTVLPVPELQVRATVALGATRVGEPLVFTIVATNAGQAAASAVLVTNALPNAQIDTATSTLGSCSNFGSYVICAIPSLPASQKATITITARAMDTNQTVFVASISSPDPDPDLSNNITNLSFKVGLPGLRSASVSIASAPGGTNLTFPVWLGGPFVQPVSVGYRTYAGINPPPSDFIPTNGTLVFNPGQTNLSVNVTVLDNGIYNGVQNCDLILENPVNAVFLNGSFFDGMIVDNIPKPVITVDDVTVVEGDAGETDALFALHLTGATALPAAVHFLTSDWTAQGGSDFISSTGMVTFPPGTSSQTIAIRIKGNTVNESNEDFYLNLGGPVDATLGDYYAVGTILNDDAVPGRLDHFAWSEIPSPQIPNRPVSASLTALDAFGSVLSNFTGSVILSASAAGGITNLGVTPVAVSNFVAGTWTGTVQFTNTGNQVMLRADDGAEHIGLSSPFTVLAKFPLQLALPAAATEGAGVLVNQGRVWLPQFESTNVWVGITSLISNILQVPDGVWIVSGQTSAVFNLTVGNDALLNGSRSVVVSVDSPSYTGTNVAMLIHDNESATLGLMLPASAPEKSGPLQGTVTASAAPAVSVSVTLTSSDTTELTVPASITMLAGQTSAVFNASVVDDSLLDGPQTVTVTASITNWQGGQAALTILDNETNQFTLSTLQGNDTPFAEGRGTVSNAFRLSVGGILLSNLLVNLGSSDTTELIVPATVMIPTGTNAAWFNSTAVDDAETDGSQPVTITASLPGFTSGSILVNLLDNDLHHFVFSPFATVQTSGIPFSVTVTAKDVNEVTLTRYTNSPIFTASGLAGPLPTATSGFSGVGILRGSFSGSVTVTAPMQQMVTLRAQDSLGQGSFSSPFQLRYPVWAGTPQITQAQVAGGNVLLSFPTVMGAQYFLETATNLPAVWQSAGPGVLGTGATLTLTNSGGGSGGRRFFRLLVQPAP